VSRVGSENYVDPPINGSTADTFDITYELISGTDWPFSRESIEAAHPGTQGGTRIRMAVNANAFGENVDTVSMTVNARVTEIELDNGHIYTPVVPGTIDPGNRLAGDMHVPWLSAGDSTIYHGYADALTSTFALKRVNAVSGTIDDLSPVVGMGVNAYAFRIRAHDSDMTYMLASVSSATQQAVYVSADEAGSWTEVVAPATGTEPYGAAFAGDSEEIIYIWGPSEYMGYSIDSGATVDDRSGNLAALSATRLVGIAGGPTP
jgi:hypothetical protein